MAYLSSSAPLPQNSLMPPPQAKVDASNARLMRDFMASRTGRQRLYSTIPTAASFFTEITPGLAVDAAQMIGQSESARQSVLIGLGLPANLQEPTLDQIVAAAPVNVSMNAPSTTGGPGQTQTGTMPATAPVEVYPGLWGNLPKPTPKRPRGTTGVGGSYRSLGSSPSNGSQIDYGPGCQASMPPPTPRAPVVMPTPPPAPNPPSPAVQPAARPPTYANVCWGLRNGVVLQEQVDPSVLYQCTQLGYSGACPAPPGAQAWMAQQTTFPKISLTPAQVAAIPPAPANIGPCPNSYALAGMSGVALDWGDAGVQQTQNGESNALPWVLGIGAIVALVVMSKKRGR